MSGSLPKGYLGGVAYITISKRNGQIVKLYHEK
ncbi:NTF2 fold immunity protein [Bacteroides sp. Ga6A2]